MDLLVFLQISTRFMKDAYKIKSQNLQRTTLSFSYDREMENFRR